jgi:L-tartrate/succinate antiporter
MTRSQIVKGVAPVLVGVGIAMMPVPDGLTPSAWRYFALFAAVVAGLILEPIPASGVGFIGMALAAASRLVSSDPGDAIKWALSGFGNGTVWLVFSAFMLALGYEKTGLGRRIALVLVRRLGGRTLGLGYAITLADVVLAPFTASNTARSAGTIFPVIRNIPALYDSHPGATSRRIGAYVMWTGFAATCVSSSMFVTALAPNLLAVSLVKQITGITISMGAWAVGFLPVGLVLGALLPLLVYVLYPPELKGGPEVPAWAGRELAGMGPVTRSEILMAAFALLAVCLWMFGGEMLDASTSALLIVSLMLVTRLISWQEVVGNSAAWNVLVLLATLVSLSDGLGRVGFIAWFAKHAAVMLTGLPMTLVLASLVAIFFLVHYMFASLTAHTSAVLPVVLTAALTVPGVPVRTVSLLLCYSLGLMGVLTPYATGPAPVYFGSGFISRADFWRLGLVFGVIFLAALLGIGLPYLSLIGG